MKRIAGRAIKGVHCTDGALPYPVSCHLHQEEDLWAEVEEHLAPRYVGRTQ